jgi:dimethylamine/trimethylamine dehydrogenase
VPDRAVLWHRCLVSYDVLFEPVAIGPVVARNRFFQVPHCNGMGYRDPSAEAAMRAVKAEGGWAVVCGGDGDRPVQRPHAVDRAAAVG